MDELAAILALPRLSQLDALRALRATVAVPDEEAWNTRFGPQSLFDAWTRSTVMEGLYAANRERLAPVVAREGFRVLEVGGGNGRLWEGLLHADARGELVVVDPVPDVHAEVAKVLPSGVALRSLVARVEEVDLPDADAAVASLVLHHVAGADADERARYGMAGPGKLEVLARLREALRARGGFLLVNEADVFCDLALAPGDPILEERLLDSYVRRCARSLIDDLRSAADPRLEAVIWRWCVDQLALAHVPREQRDVYELDVTRWLELFARARLPVRQRRFTDRYGLFCQYLLGVVG